MSSEDKKVYRCEACGSIKVFDVRSQSLKCPHCGSNEQIASEATWREHHLGEYVQNNISSDEKQSKTMECSSCGAHIEVGAEKTAISCPYCASNIVLASKQLASIVPDGIRPFQIEQNQVSVMFRNWVKGRWFAPNALKNLYEQGKVMGIYLPYWTFDAKMRCEYSAMGGKDRQVAYEDSDGNTKYRTETDWYPTFGDVSDFFDDILIRASLTLQADLMDRIGDFNTKAIVNYSPAYISGYASEVHTVEFKDALVYAKDEMDQRTRNLIEQDVLRSFDHVRDIRMHPIYSDETYKHVLLPVYSTAYSYNGKVYNVLINGDTGEIAGDYPKSAVKIALLVIVILMVVAAIYYFGQGM